MTSTPLVSAKANDGLSKPMPAAAAETRRKSLRSVHMARIVIEGFVRRQNRPQIYTDRHRLIEPALQFRFFSDLCTSALICGEFLAKLRNRLLPSIKPRNSFSVVALLLLCFLNTQAQQVLRWGADPSGGARYVFNDPNHPDQCIGYEKEMVDAL